MTDIHQVLPEAKRYDRYNGDAEKYRHILSFKSLQSSLAVFKEYTYVKFKNDYKIIKDAKQKADADAN